MNQATSAEPATPADANDRREQYAAVAAELIELRKELLALQGRAEAQLDNIDPAFRDSARNLLHYVALRQHDLRPLQERLARLGLSSLGRAEAQVIPTLDAIIATVSAVLGQPTVAQTLDFDSGRRQLNLHTEQLLGSDPDGRSTRIMVTMPRESADDETLIHDLLRRGMDCMRINCAHDELDIWRRMIDKLHQAERDTQHSCRLLMDLGGPKLRTGALPPGPAVIKLKPKRDSLGRVLAPARIWLHAATNGTAAPPDADAVVPVRSAAWLAQLNKGDHIALHDARGAARHWQLAEVHPEGCWALSEQTCYLRPRLQLQRRGGGRHLTTTIAALPHLETTLALRKGDVLRLLRDPQAARTAKRDRRGRVLQTPAIGCLPAEVLDDVRAGEPIWFDDGHIGGIIEDVDAAGAQVRITQTPAKGAKLAAGKGINLPASRLRTAALSDKDLADLAFVAEHADMVGLSFVNRPEDIERLQDELDRRGVRQPAIVLKIETRRAFQHLPALLLAAMRRSRCGVMIARGDLAVECGFERLAEIQEELLWLCEAAHVPVIWATQVLESLAKEGLPSRAEITDAAMGHRAECVMLNKGPHILDAVAALDDILHRMQGHQRKKTARLRPLHLATEFSAEPVS